MYCDVPGITEDVDQPHPFIGVGVVSSQKMLMVDTLTGRFSSVKLRGRKLDCASCGQDPALTAKSLPEFDYKTFTGQDYNDRYRVEPTTMSGSQTTPDRKFWTEPPSFLSAIKGEQDCRCARWSMPRLFGPPPPPKHHTMQNLPLTFKRKAIL